MNVIVDNIGATIIGATVMLVVMNVQFENQLVAAEASAYHMIQQQTLSFAQLIQRDMQNMSRVVDLHEDANSFEFVAQTSSVDTTQRTVEYRRIQTGTKMQDGTAVPLYQIQRYVNGVIDGSSYDALLSWQITAENQDGNAATIPAEVSQIDVKFVATMPGGIEISDRIEVEDTRWSSTFRPMMLRDRLL